VTKSEPLLATYTEYLKSVFEQKNFGSMPNPWGSGNVQISDTILEASLASFGLIGISLIISVLVGIILGLRAAKHEPPGVARWLSSLSTAGMALPPFFVGSLFFVFWFLYVLVGGPGTIPLPLSGFGWDTHLIVPVLVLMARPSVQIAQVTSGLISDEFGKQYVVASRSIGHTWSRIRRRNALRNILAAVILTIAASLRLLVGELIVVEWLFDWPGLGNLLSQTLIPTSSAYSRASVEGVLFLNPPVVAVVLAIFAALFLITDLVASILSKGFDPRLREA
jgi:peptide/nickel transport system permease protein